MTMLFNRKLPSQPVEIPAIRSERSPSTSRIPRFSKRALLTTAAVAGAVIALTVGVRWLRHSLGTVSTDDAYVNSHVTFVAPRVAGQVSSVSVDNNNRVQKGDVLVQLDPEPFRIQVEIKRAALGVAQASLELAQANTRALIAQTRGERFKLAHSMESVDDQIAQVRQRVATLDKARATLVLAQADYRRAQDLLPTKAISDEEFDQKRAALGVSEAAVTEALENVHQARVALGLPAEPPSGGKLTDVPADLDQTFSTVRETLADLLQTAAQLGITPSSFDLTPQQTIEEFYKRDPDGNLDRIYAEVLKNAPAIRQAEAVVEQARHNLEQAELDLRYCSIVAEIDGVVTRRNVNPGDYVLVGQSLMAIRSLSDIWIDANFKETQLRNLRIGQRVTLHADMYGGRHTFEGRVSGFTMGTGSTLALLPAQNATGNFVKVVQRLPVRVDLVNYDPDRLPLFVGLSVEPEVHIRSTPTGPDAGKFLQSLTRLSADSQP